MGPPKLTAPPSASDAELASRERFQVSVAETCSVFRTSESRPPPDSAANYIAPPKPAPMVTPTVTATPSAAVVVNSTAAQTPVAITNSATVLNSNEVGPKSTPHIAEFDSSDDHNKLSKEALTKLCKDLQRICASRNSITLNQVIARFILVQGNDYETDNEGSTASRTLNSHLPVKNGHKASSHQ